MRRFYSKRIRTLICTFTLIFICTTFSYANTPSRTFENLDERVNYLKSMVKFVEAYYLEEVTEEQLMEGAYKGLFDGLDPHSVYFKPEEYDNFHVETSGNFGGIGVSVGLKGDKLTVISPLEGTPGEKAGLKPGDVIISVEDQDIQGYALEKVVKMMRGEPGTKVKIGVQRNGQAHPLYFTITREEIKVNPTKHEILEGDIGYIKISQFNENTSDNVDKALEEFEGKNVKGIILDLRNNPGGLLGEAVRVADRFTPKGSPIVHIQYKNQKKETYFAEKDKIDTSLVVLVNEGSASASEIVAGAIQDTGSGIVMGTTTYGKGTVQKLIPLTNGGGMKLTIARYLTSKERNIDGIGIEPDRMIANPSNENIEVIKNFVPMVEEEKHTLGAKGLNIYGAQQRLNFMGYKEIKPTGIMDEKTFKAVQQFQAANGLYPYGVLDYTTMDRLNEQTVEVYNHAAEDLQLKEAMDKISIHL